ncbi:MAG: biotin--[acetyl-CoA-carboxylase] ligase [Proteobacteria bacterium]|nr:biotin--[acetyl-CoA-carboxylase] ligase [Pseudomonadota bacterium]
MDPQALKTNRKTTGKYLIQFHTIDSTNTWLLSQPGYLEMDGLVVRSKYQTAGRGRQTKQWEGGNKNHLFCSVVIHPQFSNEYIPAISILIGLAVYRGLTSLGVTDLSVKWPNDLLIDGKKVCGILCEMKLLPSEKQIIVAGIGINLEGTIEQFPEELRDRVTTLEQATGRIIEPERMLDILLDQLDEVLNHAHMNRFPYLFDEWEKVSSSIGKEIEYVERDERKKGTITGLSSTGYLKIKTPSNREKQIVSGEIFFPTK